MYAAPVEAYFAPETLPDALALLAERPDRTRVLAGGQSALPLLRAREDRPAVLVDLQRISDLHGIVVESDGTLRVGALTRCGELLMGDPGPGRECLTDAATGVGDRQVRNRGTLGGNLAHADITGDMGPMAAALDAVLHLVGWAGSRRVPAEAFVTGPRRTVLEDGELISHVTFPPLPSGTASAQLKYGITFNGRAVISAAVRVHLGTDGSCRDARVVVGGVRPALVRSSSAEAVLVGSSLDVPALAAAAAAAALDVPTHTDGRASHEYRTQLVRTYVRRALARALTRARSGARATPTAEEYTP